MEEIELYGRRSVEEINSSLNNDCDLYLYQQLTEREKIGIIIPRMTSALCDRKEYMMELKKEMENQGKRELPNIFEKAELSRWRSSPELFSLKNKLEVINKFWFCEEE